MVFDDESCGCPFSSTYGYMRKCGTAFTHEEGHRFPSLNQIRVSQSYKEKDCTAANWLPVGLTTRFTHYAVRSGSLCLIDGRSVRLALPYPYTQVTRAELSVSVPVPTSCNIVELDKYSQSVLCITIFRHKWPVTFLGSVDDLHR